MQDHPKRQGDPLVLVAEDDPEFRALIGYGLGLDGYEVAATANGVELGSWMAASTIVDLVISDVRMPGPSGLDVLARFRRTNTTTPFVVITAFGSAELHALALRLGATAVLDKPFEMDDLRALVRRLIGRGGHAGADEGSRSKPGGTLERRERSRHIQPKCRIVRNHVRRREPMSRSTNAILAICSIAVVVSGCAGKKQALAEAPSAPTAASTPATQPMAPVASKPTDLSEEQWFRTATLEELQARLSDVHFDYDAAQLRSDARSVIENNSQWLTRPFNTVVIEVEGHCDERGTTSYNLALGERRSRSVVDYLHSLGMPRERLRFVSYGKERPVCTEAGENCYWRNRRAYFRVASKGAGYSDE
jgi:peptidoglycan-associated lipoprotein